MNVSTKNKMPANERAQVRSFISSDWTAKERNWIQISFLFVLSSFTVDLHVTLDRTVHTTLDNTGNTEDSVVWHKDVQLILKVVDRREER